MSATRHHPVLDQVSRLVLAALFLAAGALHLAAPGGFVRIMPPAIPWPREVVLFTGACEIAGAAGLLLPRTRRLAGILLAAYCVCVFPANLYHAFGRVHAPPLPDSWWYHGPRLAFQPVLVWWSLLAGGVVRWPPMPVTIEAADLPAGALLGRYAGQGGYADCLVVRVPGHVTQAAFVEAFYTTALFKLERLVLAVLLARPSSDAQARRLAAGQAERFAAWTVEARTADQILLCDFLGASRSWLMSAPAAAAGDASATTLRFGTALVPRRGAPGLGLGFRALVPFHRVYAPALLRAAVRRLAAARTT
ncbi:DoxX family protein [Caulobacter sp. KR2-114]|uniref:DoxX family protein n=1 Tax=Caulobacter sp. KR2-114 TaxID=3400912 RepID=UPI003BFA8EEF